MTSRTFELFRPGVHTDMHGRTHSFSVEDVAAIAAGYNPGTREAPLVVGHPRTDSPAYGWVEKLSVEDGKLVATPKQVDPAFAELVKAGRYKRVSASFYTPEHPSNPTPGSYYLRHVGFLGATPPAVSGLKAVELAEPGEGVVEFAWEQSARAQATIFRRLRDFFIAQFGLEKADEVLPAWQLETLEADAREAAQPAAYQEQPQPQPTPGADMSDEEKKRAAALELREAAVKQAEQQLAAEELQAKRREVGDFADGLVKAGKLLPKDKVGVVELIVQLDKSAPLEFAEEGKAVQKPAADFVRSLLAALPVQVDLAERAGGDKPAADTSAEGIAKAAVAYQADQAKKGIEVRTADAVRAVTKS